MKKAKLGLIALAIAGIAFLGASSEPIPEETAESEASIVAESEATESIATYESVPTESEATPAEPIDEAEKAVKDFVDTWLAPERIVTYITALSYIGTIIGLFRSWKKEKQNNTLTLADVLKKLTEVIEKVASKEIADQFAKVVPNLLSGQENTNKVLTIFAEILALSQEDTPESRIAILNLIKELGTTSKELVDNAKNAIEEAVKTEQVAKEEANEQLDGIIDQYDKKDEYDGTSI